MSAKVYVIQDTEVKYFVFLCSNLEKELDTKYWFMYF